MNTGSSHTIAVFASEKGPGDAERASFMSQTGQLLARKGVRIVCMADGDALPVPLLTAARTAGGEVTIIAGETFNPPAAHAGVTVERLKEPEEQWQLVADISDAFIGLPGSLISANNLFNTWVAAGSGASGKPVGLLNRNRAFEVMRGFYMDVLSQSVPDAEKMVVFSESIEDLLTRVLRVINRN